MKKEQKIKVQGVSEGKWEVAITCDSKARIALRSEQGFCEPTGNFQGGLVVPKKLFDRVKDRVVISKKAAKRR